MVKMFLPLVEKRASTSAADAIARTQPPTPWSTPLLKIRASTSVASTTAPPPPFEPRRSSGNVATEEVEKIFWDGTEGRKRPRVDR